MEKFKKGSLHKNKTQILGDWNTKATATQQTHTSYTKLQVFPSATRCFVENAELSTFEEQSHDTYGMYLDFTLLAILQVGIHSAIVAPYTYCPSVFRII